FLAARNRQCAVAEDAFAISKMPDPCLDAPLLGRVSRGCFLFADRTEHPGCFPSLLFEAGDDVLFRNEIDVALHVGSVLGGGGSITHDNIIAWQRSVRSPAKKRRGAARR